MERTFEFVSVFLSVPVDLNRIVPDWQSLSEAELQARLRDMVLSGQIAPA